MVKNFNLCVKSRFWAKIGFFVKIEMLVKYRNLGQKSKVWSKIEIGLKNLNLGQKSKFCSKIESLVKIEIWVKILIKKRILIKTKNFRSKIEILVNNRSWQISVQKLANIFSKTCQKFAKTFLKIGQKVVQNSFLTINKYRLFFVTKLGLHKN